MKNFKSLSALLLAVCLVLSMAVPAVWAEEDAEVKEVTHHFDIRKLKTDGVVSNISGNSLFNVGTTGLGDETKGIAWNYNNGKIDWKVKAYSLTTDKANDVSFTSYDYFRARASVDDWIAFTFKNPGAGKWELSLGHIVTTAGAEEMAVYILPGSVVKSDGTATEDIAAELRSAEALGTVNCYDTAGTITSDTPNGSDTTANLIKKVSTALNEWTSGDPVETPEYILVLQSVKASAAEKAYIYASSLTLTPVFATVGDQTYNDAASAVTAIAGAEAGTNVTINSDLSLSANLTTAANIIVARGATLDLAGKTLTAGEVNIAGALVDTVGDGLLVTSAAITCSGDNGGYLPLTDSTAGGYRLCKPTLETLGKVPGNNGTAAYWFHAHFENEAAYGYTGVEIGVQMTWDGGSKGAWAGETFMGNWATQVKADNDLDIKLTVTGLNSVTNFKLTPVIQANGVTISMNTL